MPAWPQLLWTKLALRALTAHTILCNLVLPVLCWSIIHSATHLLKHRRVLVLGHSSVYPAYPQTPSTYPQVDITLLPQHSRE